MNIVRVLVSSLILLCFSGPVSWAQELLLVGSSTVSNYAFFGKEEAYRQGSDIAFDVITSSSGRGVLALSEGHADIAMISSSFAPLVEKLNAQHGAQINPDDYDVHEIAQAHVLFVVHPDNPVKHLSKQQVQDIFTGRVTQWPQVGVHRFDDIKVVTEHPTGGMYRWVLDHVNDETPFADDTIVMQNAPQIALVVSQVPEAFGFVSDATPKNQMHSVKTVHVPNLDTTQHLFFVTRKGQTSAAAYDLIQYITKALAH